MSKAIVRHLREPARLVVRPAVVHAREPAALDGTQRERQMAVGAAVLECPQPAVVAAVERDGAAPERDLHRAPTRHRALMVHRVPVVGVEAGRADLLAPVARLGERRRRVHDCRRAPASGGAVAVSGDRRRR